MAAGPSGQRRSIGRTRSPAWLTSSLGHVCNRAVRTRPAQRTREVRPRGGQSTGQETRPPARTASQVRPPRPEGAPCRRRREELPLDRPRPRHQQEHRRRHRQTTPGKSVGFRPYRNGPPSLGLQQRRLRFGRVEGSGRGGQSATGETMECARAALGPRDRSAPLRRYDDARRSFRFSSSNGSAVYCPWPAARRSRSCRTPPGISRWRRARISSRRGHFTM